MHPVQYTPASFRAAMLEHKPELAGELDEILTGLQDNQIEVTRRQTQLATFLQREVSLTQREGAHVFRWHNQHGREVELTLPPSTTSGSSTAPPNHAASDHAKLPTPPTATAHHAPPPTGNAFTELAALLGYPARDALDLVTDVFLEYEQTAWQVADFGPSLIARLDTQSRAQVHDFADLMTILETQRHRELCVLHLLLELASDQCPRHPWG